jgi:hypothetical protein
MDAGGAALMAAGIMLHLAERHAQATRTTRANANMPTCTTMGTTPIFMHQCLRAHTVTCTGTNPSTTRIGTESPIMRARGDRRSIAST